MDEYRIRYAQQAVDDLDVHLPGKSECGKEKALWQKQTAVTALFACVFLFAMWQVRIYYIIEGKKHYLSGSIQPR